VKLLTLTQPWATLVAIGAKRIETRSWQTPYRGPIAIHAAKGLNGIRKGATEGDFAELCCTSPFIDALDAWWDEFDPDGWKFSPEFLPRGAIVAVADLVEIEDADAIVGRAARWGEQAFGDYSAGRYGWMLDNVRALPSPITCRGERGLPTLNPAVASEVTAQLARCTNG
jgi:hypothetical protein